jgi:hypothetical protein
MYGIGHQIYAQIKKQGEHRYTGESIWGNDTEIRIGPGEKIGWGGLMAMDE